MADDGATKNSEVIRFARLDLHTPMTDTGKRRCVSARGALIADRTTSSGVALYCLVKTLQARSTLLAEPVYYSNPARTASTAQGDHATFAERRG